ncbi:hypothetical protein Hanom_Chr13g01199321 [Helianthus anomalus]
MGRVHRPKPENFILTRTQKSYHKYEPKHDSNISGLTRTRPAQPEFSNFNFFRKLIY